MSESEDAPDVIRFSPLPDRASESPDGRETPDQWDIAAEDEYYYNYESKPHWVDCSALLGAHHEVD